MDDGFIEAGSSGGEAWKPEKEGDTITGVFQNQKENVGINNSNVYLIKEDGKEESTSVWGSTVLDTKFAEIPQGSLVKITYLGLEKGKGPKAYKNFKVLYKPSKIADVFPGSEIVG